MFPCRPDHSWPTLDLITLNREAKQTVPLLFLICPPCRPSKRWFWEARTSHCSSAISCGVLQLVARTRTEQSTETGRTPPPLRGHRHHHRLRPRCPRSSYGSRRTWRWCSRRSALTLQVWKKKRLKQSTTWFSPILNTWPRPIRLVDPAWLGGYSTYGAFCCLP